MCFSQLRNPFLVNLHPDFFQVRTDLLDFAQQVVPERRSSCSILRVHARHRDGQVRGFRVVAVRGLVVGSGVALLVQLRDLQAIVLLLIFQLRDRLPRADQFLVLIVEALEAVAADAALFPVQRLGACSGQARAR